MNTDIQISAKPLSVQQCIDWVMSPDCGGIDVFIGTVRSNTKGKIVLRLEFEAYEKMALNELQKIAQQSFEKWPVQKVVIRHRTGILQIGEIPVIIAVAAAHRDAAFEACRYIIDTLKQTVPIWKKEFFEDGEIWVAAHP
ncbi:molybdenum cofactor biosynthesis protein MoaE [Mucilaginibacter ximonensis]|uniref:Molybdopterin synthase catalytic subunit n=1 Tax=Mucilaginibacter ximonensis TaxID=538021 RepID=A0ABW5Y8V0_9SPHI